MGYAEAMAAREKIKLSAVVGGASAVMTQLEQEIAHILRPTIEDCMRIGADVVRERAAAYFKAWIGPPLMEMWRQYCAETGAPPADDARLYQKGAWADALDDRLETFFEPHQHIVSADWLTTATISNSLFNEAAVHDMAASFAAEVYKNITYYHSRDPANDEGHELSPAKILAAVGIVASDIEMMLATRKKPTVQQVEEHKMATMQETVTKAHEWTKMLAMNDGQIELSLDNASDSDDGLAASGVQDLGCGVEDVPQFRALRSMMDVKSMVQVIRSGVAPVAATVDTTGDYAPPIPQGVTLPPVPPVPPVPQASAVPPVPATTPPATPQTSAEPPPARRRGKGQPPGNAVPARLLAILKDHTGLKTEELGAGLGVSRGTFDNYAKGKAHLVPDTTQIDFLRKLIGDKIALLTEAQSLLP